MIRRLLLSAMLAFSLIACGGESAQDESSQQPPAASTAQPEAPAAAPSAPDSAAPDAGGTSADAASPAGATDEAAAAQESTEENATSTSDDAALARVAALPADQQLPSGRWKAGQHYVPLTPAQPTNVSPGKVEVVEVFWFGCSHCYALEPHLQSWKKSKPDYVEFTPVPVMWGPVHKAHARLFYTLQALGRLDIYPKVFEAVHQKGNMLAANDPDKTEEMQIAFVRQYGIPAQDFRKAENSFAVNSNLQRAEELTRRYRVEGVPLIVVNGKYVTDVSRAGGPEQLLALINDLAAGEKRR